MNQTSDDLAAAESALQFISPDVDREDWVRVGMALEHELGEAGFDLFNHWSSHGQKYQQADTLATWKSFKSTGSNGGTISIATLFKMARDNGYRGKKSSHQYQPSPAPAIPAETEAEATQKRQAAQGKAKVFWAKGTPVTAHPYAKKKGLKPDKLRVSGDALLIPMYNTHGKLSSEQIIQPDGKKKFLKGCAVAGCYFPIGKPIGDTLIIAEGWATGMSIHLATGHAVAVALSSGNLGNVARIMRQKHPNFEIMLAPDNDKTRHAIDKAEAAAREHGCYVVYPRFPEGGHGDFDDLRQQAGPAEVKRQITEECYQPVTEENPELDSALPDFPLDALGPVLAEAGRAIANVVQAPAHLAGQSVLAAAALATQAHANVVIDGRTHPLSLFCLTVGESGERKSTCDYWALKSAREWERQQQKEARGANEVYRNDLDTWKRDRQQALKKGGGGLDGFRPEPVQPPSGTFICEEPTLEGLQKSFRFGLASQGLFSDEAGQFLGGHAMNPDNALKTMSGLSKFWDGAAIKRTRAAHGESWAGYNRRLSCHLMAQPIVAGVMLSDPLMREQGLLARFLLASGKHLFGQRRYCNPSPEDMEAINRYHAAMTALLTKSWAVDEDGGLELATIQLTDKAMQLWIEVHDVIEEEMADSGDYQGLRAAASKMAENIARMAGVLAVFSGHTAIDAKTMHNSIRLGDYFLEQYGLLTRSGWQHVQAEQDAKLLGWLRALDDSTVDVDTISRHAPTETGVRWSVDKVRAAMQRLAKFNAVTESLLNKYNRPKEWKVRQ